jgi:hypothetical protein
MKRSKRILLVPVLAAFVIVALAAPAAAKKVQPKRYAKTVCNTLTDVLDAATADEESYNALPADDPAAFQAAVLELSEEFLATLEDAQAKVAKVTPKVKGGKKEAEIFVDYFDVLVADLEGAIDTFAAADPTSPGFVGDATRFEATFNNLLLTAPDPFAQVTNQGLIEAFDQKACEDHVQVF